MRPTTIVDVLPVRIWMDRIDGPRARAHGSELVNYLAGLEPGIDGVPGDPTKHASDAIEQLIASGRIRRLGSKPDPSRDQIVFGVGGTFNVRGVGAPDICWWYTRG